MSEGSNQPFWKRLKNIDTFGRDITLYYKGKEKSKTYFGSAFTILYLSLYLTFLIYKLIKMLKKTDVTFYDSEIVPKERPFIQLNNDNFYGGFALEDPNTYDPFIDETIYTVKAFFKRAERSGGKWNWQVKEIELEQCKMEKFGELYREKFIKKPMNKYYCFKEMNFKLEGAFSYDAYSMFYIQFFPCINTTENNNHCKSLEEIDYYLDGTFLSLQMEDIELTPDNFKEPIRQTAQDVYTTVGKKLFKEFHIYLKIVNVETDVDFFGLYQIESKKVEKKEKFIKYDYSNAMTNIINNDIYKTGECFADMTIKLSNYVLTQKRTYVKLLDILGDVGGLMEVVLFVFKIISSFSTNLLFETSLVNSLFEFDLASNQVYIRRNNKKIIEKKSSQKRDVPPLENIPLNQKSLISNSQSNNDDNLKDLPTKRKLNSPKKNNYVREVESEDLINRKRRKKLMGLRLNIGNKPKKEINANNNVVQKENRIPAINYERRRMLTQNTTNNNLVKKSNRSNKEINESSLANKKKINAKYMGREKINKINLGKFWIYVFFICAKKRKNVHAILLNETMKIISENLDIKNVFRKIYGKSKTEKLEIIRISDKCKKELDTLAYI